MPEAIAVPWYQARSQRLQWTLTSVGLALLAAAAYVFWQHAGAPPPYRYVDAPAGAVDVEFKRMQVISAEGDQLVAEADIVEGKQGPVLMGWRAQVDDPLLYLAVPAEESKALTSVVARHRAADSPVLAWWDTSRQLQHWGAGAMVFDRHLAVPLFVPERWRALEAKVAHVERGFWGEGDDGVQRAAFDTFARALAAPEAEGVKLLRTLAGGRKAVLVLHLRDMLLLGQLFPRQLSVSFQDFSDSGDVHRSVRGVHGWLREGEQAAYGVIKLPGNVLRAVALKDEATAHTLAARLLPFIGNRQDDVAGLTLVYRTAAFSVFELEPQ